MLEKIKQMRYFVLISCGTFQRLVSHMKFMMKNFVSFPSTKDKSKHTKSRIILLVSPNLMTHYHRRWTSPSRRRIITCHTCTVFYFFIAVTYVSQGAGLGINRSRGRVPAASCRVQAWGSIYKRS